MACYWVMFHRGQLTIANVRDVLDAVRMVQQSLLLMFVSPITTDRCFRILEIS